MESDKSYRFQGIQNSPGNLLYRGNRRGPSGPVGICLWRQLHFRSILYLSTLCLNQAGSASPFSASREPDSCVCCGSSPDSHSHTSSFKPLSNVQSGLHASYFFAPLVIQIHSRIHLIEYQGSKTATLLNYHTKPPAIPQVFHRCSDISGWRCTSRGPIHRVSSFPPNTKL